MQSHNFDDDHPRPFTPPPVLIIDDPDTELLDNDRAVSSQLQSEYSTRQPSPVTDYNLLQPSSISSAVDGLTTISTTPPLQSNPFNFQTQVISRSPVKSVSIPRRKVLWSSLSNIWQFQAVGQRRGHRYKHSSVSTQHQIFQEPPPRPPPVLPASLPIPTVSEAWRSMYKDQKRRLYWSLGHLGVATFVFYKSESSLSATALSHLVFFDAGSAAVCVAVEVLGNFEVWRRSSVRHPFGLERAEVLAGFAMSIFLLFGGFDLISHNIKHSLEGLGDHEPHHEHGHESISALSIDIVAIVAIVSTILSAYVLKNHARIARIMRLSYIAALPSILSNPFHFLTLSISTLIAGLALFSISLYAWLDSTICAIISLAMLALGIRVAIAQGLMLLMSYNDNGNDSSVSNVLREIEAEPSVSRIIDAQFWQVHYGLCMANLKLSVSRGYDEHALAKLRNRVAGLVQSRLSEGYGNGSNVQWEVTLQLSTENGDHDFPHLQTVS